MANGRFPLAFPASLILSLAMGVAAACPPGALAQTAPASQADIQRLRSDIAAISHQIDSAESTSQANVQAITDLRFSINSAAVWVEQNGSNAVRLAESYPNHVHYYQMRDIKWNNNMCIYGDKHVDDSEPCSYITTWVFNLQATEGPSSLSH